MPRKKKNTTPDYSKYERVIGGGNYFLSTGPREDVTKEYTCPNSMARVYKTIITHPQDGTVKVEVIFLWTGSQKNLPAGGTVAVPSTDVLRITMLVPPKEEGQPETAPEPEPKNTKNNLLHLVTTDRDRMN